MLSQRQSLTHTIHTQTNLQGKQEDRLNLIRLAVDTYGKIDAVVLCTGIQPGPATQDETLDVPSEMFDKVSS